MIFFFISIKVESGAESEFLWPSRIRIRGFFLDPHLCSYFDGTFSE